MGFGVIKYILFISLFSVQLFADVTHRFSFSQALQNYFIDDGRRVGIEVEYQNLTLDKAVAITQSLYGGTVEHTKSSTGMEIRILRNTDIGDLKLKVETNQIGEIPTPQSQWVYELVGPPLNFKDNIKLQVLLNMFKIAGATGTAENNPVSIQTNVEADPKDTQTLETIKYIKKLNLDPNVTHELIKQVMTKPDIKFQFNVLRNFQNNSHFLKKEHAPADSRRIYIQPVSPGMSEKMRDPNYNPTEEEILYDYLYRQTLEYMGFENAWEMPLEKVKKLMEDHHYPINKRVAKLTDFRFTSMLLFMFPEDPLLQKYLKYEWIFSAPIHETRYRNNDFNIVSAIKEDIGLINATKKHGLFIYEPETGELNPLKNSSSSLVTCQKLFSY
jgi:hypothetical protein